MAISETKNSRITEKEKKLVTTSDSCQLEVATGMEAEKMQICPGRNRLGSNNLLEPITAIDEVELAQQLKNRQLYDLPKPQKSTNMKNIPSSL